LHIFQVKTDTQIVWNNILRLEGLFDYGWIIDGKNQDSDYLTDNRGGESSRSNNVTDDDDVFDFSLGAGLQFYLNAKEIEELLSDQLKIVFLGGYSYHEQNLRITDGFQTIPATGSFGGLNSTYQTEWDGLWAGLEFSGIKDRFTGLARFEYHWVDYYAEADWNLRTDFAHPKSFEHIADGTGMTLIFDGSYRLNNAWSLDLNVDVKNWSAGAGIDRTFSSTGTISETRFNEVNWISYAVMGGITYHFPN